MSPRAPKSRRAAPPLPPEEQQLELAHAARSGRETRRRDQQRGATARTAPLRSEKRHYPRRRRRS